MKRMVLFTILILQALSWPVLGADDPYIDRKIVGFPDLPAGARSVAERTMECRCFWGEVVGDGSERDREVKGRLKNLDCDHVENDPKVIRSKYRKNPEILKILQEAESQ